MKRFYPWLVGLVVLFGGAATVGRFGDPIGLKYSDGIVFATGLILLWYTIETRSMRLEMVRQNDMAVRPLLVTSIEIVTEEMATWSGRSGTTLIPFHSEGLVIHNVGRGPALSVHIEDMVDGLLRVTFDAVDVIPAEAAEPARATVYVEDVKADDTLTAFVASLKATSNQTYRLTVRYRDVTGKPHFSVMQMGKGGARLLEHSGVEV